MLNSQDIPNSTLNICDSHFEGLFQKSKLLKEEANKNLKTNIDLALDQYHRSIEILLKSKPKPVTYKEDFKLEWKLEINETNQKIAKEHFATIFSNCSFVYLIKNNPLMALYYAKFSYWCNECFFKARMRIAKAQIELLYLHEAKKLLNKLRLEKECEPFQNEIQKMLEEANFLIAKYSSPAIKVDFLRGELNWIEEKAFVGPIEEFYTENRGRGFRAKKDILRGDLLLIERGFVYGDKKADFCYHLITKLDQREDLKALYMNLYPCPQYPLSKELQNSLQGRTRELKLKSLFNSHLKANFIAWKNFSEAEVNELLAKAQYDSFQVNETPALFPHLSALNHSCDPNTSVWYVEDMVMVLARRNISKGEEICVSYTPVVNDKFQRRSKLSFYGFECKCERCEERGEWKEKEAKVNGLKCVKCSNDVSCNNEWKFVCLKGCWETHYSLYEYYEEEFKNMLLEVEKEIEGKEDTKLLKLLETVNERFSSYHNNRALALKIAARFYAPTNNHKEFQKYFSQIVEMIEYYPTLELRVILNELLVEIVRSFERKLLEEELRVFDFYGLSLEVTISLWNKFIKDKETEWFLPFEIRKKKEP